MKRWNVFTLKSRNKPELDFSITDADLLRLLHCGVIIWPCVETPDIKLERVQAGADTPAPPSPRDLGLTCSSPLLRPVPEQQGDAVTTEPPHPQTTTNRL
ncbi:hypothetical protein Pelo_3150 [Pelomyxa schiedti]|nr:hypothetical protein Pelo_3150 [Pelomyxa schiedti]